MGNAFCYSCSPCQEPNDISTDIIRAVEGMQHVDDLITFIDNKLTNREQHPNPTVVSSMNSGGDLIEKLSKRLKWHICKKCLLSTLDRQTRKVVTDILSRTRHIQCVGMALSVVAHLLERAELVSSNKDQCLHLLSYMCVLAKHMKDLDIHLQRDKVDKILRFIVNGTLICALQMKHNTLCRFISAPLDNDDLKNLESQLVHSYQDLELQALTTILNRLPAVPPPSQGLYPDYAVGIDEAEKRVIELLDLKDPGPRVVVIYGVGGIGKTTLATAVFNRLVFSDYNYCRVCMDQDSNDLKAKQKQILNDLFKKHLELRDFTEGQEKLVEAFKEASKPEASKPVFLFIDNALRREDLEKLLPIQYLPGLHKLSRILLTTRNLQQVDIFGPIQVYPHNVDCLLEPEAKRLLCHHALDDVNLSFDRDVNIDGLLQTCGGIPLVLKIAGSELRRRGNTVPVCNEIIKEMEDLKELERGEDLSERIVDFVYRQLRESSKEAFLDICFFFYNWERSRVGDIVGERQFEDLERAALVTTSQEDVIEWFENFQVKKRMVKVKVHDIVRARGKKLSEGNRVIVSDEETLGALLGADEQKLQQAKGIWVPRDCGELSIEAKHVDLMSRSLRVLALGQRTRFHPGCERAFQELRFLDISYEDMSQLQLRRSGQLACLIVHLMITDRISEAEFTINIPDSLQLLEVDASDFSALLHINGPITSLRGLKLSRITLGNFETSISQLKSLHSLQLRSCGGFTSIPESLGDFLCLKILNLRECSQLERLPDSLGNLSSLRDLDLTRCSMLEGLPKNFGNLCSIQNLGISKCSMLKSFPESFGNLSSLQHLAMSECSMLERLPEMFGNLSSIQKLGMNECSMLERLPESFGNLFSLQTLSMRRCDKLERLPERFGNLSNLQQLNMSACSTLERLPESFGSLSNLQRLEMAGCSKLERLPESFGSLSNLQYLNMGSFSKLERLPESFGSLSNLQRLYMAGCSKLERLPESFGSLSNLRHLVMFVCSKLEGLPESFGSLSNLQHLDMSECSTLERLPGGFGNLYSLQTLNMNGCEKICSLFDDYGQLECLKFPSIRNCKELKRLPDGIECSTSLAAMKASGCPELEAKVIDSLVKIKSLMFLEMRESPMLIRRWEEIQQDCPPIGAALGFERYGYPYGEIMSAMFLHGGSRVVHVDGDGQLAEVASSSFPDVGVKVGLLLTPCNLSEELKQKLLEVASQGYQIMYVDVEVGREGEGSRWMEEREKRIRKMLVQLPEGSRAWTSPFHKATLLFAYSLLHFTVSFVEEFHALRHAADTSIVGTRVVVDEEGRRKLSHDHLEMIFPMGDRDHRLGEELQTLFFPFDEAWQSIVWPF